jgi:hypothetical protein
MAFPPGTIASESDAPARRKYRITVSFAAVHFGQTKKGAIVFLPQGAAIRVIGRSFCLPAGFEVVFEHQHYNVFEIDVFARSTPICEPVKTKRRAGAA